MAIDPQRSLPRSGDRMSIEEYFRLDYTAPDAKYEYQYGAVRLMAGDSGEHSEIAFHMRTALKQRIRSDPYSVQGSDMRVQVADDTYVFPDVTLSCDVADRRRGNKLIRSARIVVEVLSPSTEKYDRTDKLKLYKAYPTIQEIVLISQFAPHVEVYRRDEQDSTIWHHTFYGPGQMVMLESVDVEIPLEEIYQDIDFDEPLSEE